MKGLDMTSREDLREIISLTIENVDLKFSGELEKLRGEVKGYVGKKIAACQEKQTGRRRFNGSFVVSLLSILVATCSVVIAVFM